MIKLLLIGHAQHGKDTAAEILRDVFGFNFESSSIAASKIFLYDALKDKYGYTSPEECFNDRVNHRAEWYDLICEFNKNDRARLAKEILKTSNVYVGMRDNKEIEECLKQGVFDYVIGIYNPNKPLEPSNSFNIDLWQKSDMVISNAGTIEDLKNKLSKLNFLFN
jgi:dephospho-CoA kinase